MASAISPLYIQHIISGDMSGEIVHHTSEVDHNLLKTSIVWSTSLKAILNFICSGKAKALCLPPLWCLGKRKSRTWEVCGSGSLAIGLYIITTIEWVSSSVKNSTAWYSLRLFLVASLFPCQYLTFSVDNGIHSSRVSSKYSVYT